MRYIIRKILNHKILFFITIPLIICFAALELARGGVFSQTLVVLQGGESNEQSTNDESSIQAVEIEQGEVRFSEIIAILKQGDVSKTFDYLYKKGSNLAILFMGLLLVTVLGLYQLLLWVKNFLIDILCLKVSVDIRYELFSKIVKLPSSIFKQVRSSEFISRAFNDIQVVQTELFNLFETLITSPLILIGGVTILFFIDVPFTVVLFFCGLLIAVLLGILGKRLKIVVTMVQTSLSYLTDHMAQVLQAMDVLKVFTAEKYEKKRYKETLSHFLKQSIRERGIIRAVRPLTESVGTLGVLVIVLFGMNRVWGGLLEFKDIMTYSIFLVLLSPYIQKISSAGLSIQRIRVVSTRIQEVLNYDEEAMYNGQEMLGQSFNNLEFKNVCFQYPESEKQVLNNINLKINKGEMVAFVGASGSGKTTLLNLIPLLLRPTSGQIMINGTDSVDLKLDELRKWIAMVTQDTLLFPASIRDNLLFGDPSAKQAKIDSACKAANIFEFINSLPEGFDTYIGERGVKISGGQRQRLSIARAMVKDPEILLLDEATSALDSESEKIVQNAINDLIEKHTTIVVAHRLSTILKADKIFVLDEGQVVEAGTHKELLLKNGKYKLLFDSQFS